MQIKTMKIAAHVCRAVLAATFICSGFVKSVDPWGTALRVNEYLSIYGLDALERWSMEFSIWLCGAELMMGLMLLFKVRIRLVSIFTLASMTLFTVITFLSATWLPVEDCGCFGDALKLTPWQTFAKNLVLLPMAYVVWRRYRPDKIFAFRTTELLLMALFFSLSMGIGIYSCRHLPLVDFLPYKIGVNLDETMRAAVVQDAAPETVLVYRNLKTGRTREFRLDDKEWQDESTWEWVDTRTTHAQPAIHPTVAEFSIRDVEGDATTEILRREGRVYMLCATRLDGVGRRCSLRFEAAIRRAAEQGASVVLLTADPLREVTYRGFGSQQVRCYNVDAATLKTMLRAKNGVVVLDSGTIVDKRNCRDMDF